MLIQCQLRNCNDQRCAVVMAQPQRGVCRKKPGNTGIPQVVAMYYSMYSWGKRSDEPSNFGVRYFYITPYPAISVAPRRAFVAIESSIQMTLNQKPGVEILDISRHVGHVVAHQRDKRGNWGNPNVWRGFFIGMTGGRIFYEISLGKILLFEELG